LKKEFSNLTTVCDETTYMRLENIIIIYELKLRKFKEDFENKTSSRVMDYHRFESLNENHSMYNRENNNHSSYREKTSNRHLLIGLDNENSSRYYETENNLNDKYFSNRNFDENLIGNSRRIKNENYYDLPTTHNLYNETKLQQQQEIVRPQMCDKCIETVNDIGTQTVDDDIFYLRNTSIDHHHHHKVNNPNLVHRKKSNNSGNSNQSKLRNRGIRNGTNNLNSNNQENCGKKLLLEAYLKNNNSNGKTFETTTSENETYASEQTNVFRVETTTTTTTTTRESGIGTHNEEDVDELPIVDDYKKSLYNLYKIDNIQQSDQNNNNEVVDNLNKIPENFNKSQLPDLVCEKKVLVNKLNSDNLNSIVSKPLKDKNLGTFNKSNKKSDGYFKKLLKFLLVFSIFFLVLLFFLYRFLFNPVCCDLKRDYLFVNYD
jgi:hypothetical protein